jgi:hypothetical protein
MTTHPQRSRSAGPNFCSASPDDHDTAMTSAARNSFYLQPSHNGGVQGTSPLSKPAYVDTEDDEPDVNEFMAAGRRDPEVYERTLQSWRVAIRRPIVRMVEKESHVIAAMQVLRSPHSYSAQPSMLTISVV